MLDVARAQLAHAQLADLFDAVFSADEVRALKPAPAPYRMAAESSNVPIGDLWLVAAHAWDVSGAMAAGCRAEFVARSGLIPSPLGEQPHLIAADLSAIAECLLTGNHRKS